MRLVYHRNNRHSWAAHGSSIAGIVVNHNGGCEPLAPTASGGNDTGSRAAGQQFCGRAQRKDGRKGIDAPWMRGVARQGIPGGSHHHMPAAALDRAGGVPVMPCSMHACTCVAMPSPAFFVALSRYRAQACCPAAMQVAAPGAAGDGQAVAFRVTAKELLGQVRRLRQQHARARSWPLDRKE